MTVVCHFNNLFDRFGERQLQTNCKQNCKQKLFQSSVFYVIRDASLCLHYFVCNVRFWKQPHATWLHNP